MLRKCKICTSKYDYCHSCALTKNPIKNAGYCSEDCYQISVVLQRYGSHQATAKQIIEALKQYNIKNKTLQPGIQAYYDKVFNASIKEVVPEEDVEVVIKNDKDMTISENE